MAATQSGAFGPSTYQLQLQRQREVEDTNWISGVGVELGGMAGGVDCRISLTIRPRLIAAHYPIIILFSLLSFPCTQSIPIFYPPSDSTCCPTS
jgi:hypothetical protein